MLGTSFFHCRSIICTASLTADIAQHMESLAWRVRLAVGENQVWLALREVEEHLSKVAVRPREPWAGVLPVIDGDGLVNEPKTTSVLHDPQSVPGPNPIKQNAHVCNRVERVQDLGVAIGAVDGRNVGHRPGVPSINVRATARNESHSVSTDSVL